ncbi:transporter [Dyella silvatica]|uniref:transporter n=1 Tax=Dyella silvatica TaxID=2992128 RepID=UPI00225859B1|nr:transporter [Dyella silvatica]
MNLMQRLGMCFLLCLSITYFAHPLPAHAQSTNNASGIETRADAWWTGPMLANSAETLPPGHFLFEPYLYDVSSTPADSFGSRAYVLYGLADRFTVGMIPIVGYNRVSNGPSSSGVQMGDLILQAQYRLTQFHEGSSMPTIALQLQETLPTGKYDRLGSRPSNGVGSGSYSTTLGINSQTYFWLPNGRILRMRFNVTQSFSRSANVTGVSVYGTDAAFRGNAKPGSAFYANAAWEYSLTQRWVLALDAIYSHNHNTRVSGYDVLGIGSTQDAPRVRFNSGSSAAFGFAPAIEYSWTPNLGVLLGSRFILGGHRSHSSITPAIAINYVH